MGISVDIKDGTGTRQKAGVDHAGRLHVENLDPPQKNIDVVSASNTIIGETQDHSVPESSGGWRLKQITVTNNITRERFADNGKYTQIWDNRNAAFAGGGYVNQFSMFFDGANDYIALGNPAELSFERTDTFSLSAWINTTNTGERGIFTKQGSSNNAGYRLTSQSNQLRFHLSGGAAGNRIEVRSPTVTLSDGLWHHVAVTYDGSSTAAGVTLYIDAIAQTPTVSADTLSSSTLTAVGAQISGRNITSIEFLGGIDEVSAFNIELTSDEVVEIQNSGVPVDVREHSKALSLVGYWRMGDEDLSNFPTLTDFSEVGNNGTAMNMLLSSINADTP